MFPLAYIVGMSCIQGLRLTLHENICCHLLLCLPSSLSVSWGLLLLCLMVWPHHKYVTLFTPFFVHKVAYLNNVPFILHFILLKRLTTEEEKASYNIFILWETVGQNSRDNFLYAMLQQCFYLQAICWLYFMGKENQDAVVQESYRVLNSSN